MTPLYQDSPLSKLCAVSRAFDLWWILKTTRPFGVIVSEEKVVILAIYMAKYMTVMLDIHDLWNTVTIIQAETVRKV